MGAARRERHLVGARAEALRHHGPRVVEHQPGVAGRAVQTARVGVPVRRGLERRPSGRVQRRARGVIEVRRSGSPTRRIVLGKTYRRPARS